MNVNALNRVEGAGSPFTSYALYSIQKATIMNNIKILEIVL